jgi:hypothetical protein
VNPVEVRGRAVPELKGEADATRYASHRLVRGAEATSTACSSGEGTRDPGGRSPMFAEESVLIALLPSARGPLAEPRRHYDGMHLAAGRCAAMRTEDE